MGKWMSMCPVRAPTMLALLLGMCPPVAAQAPSSAVAARARGVAILSRGLEAMGGVDRLSSLRSVLLEAEVTQYQIGQAPRPDEAATRLGTSVYALTRDLDSGAWYLESSVSREATEPRLRVVNGLDDRFQYDLRNKAILEIPEGLGLGILSERLPFAPMALLGAWGRSETVRSLPPAGDGTMALTYADSVGRQIALTFDGDGLLRSMETVERHPQFGDVVKASAFSDYRPVGGFLLPFRVVNTLGPTVTIQSDIFGIVPDSPVDEALLRRPEGGSAASPQGRPTVAGGAQKVEEIVPGIYQILNVTPLYNVMLVRQDDEVYVIEAPGDAESYELVQDSARNVLGGEEITAVVLTHHHFDHTSNLWRYLAAGKKIIAPAGDEEFVRSVARAPRMGIGSTEVTDPDLDLVEGRRMVGSGPNRFELIDVGPNPHADEILVAYFPEHRLLWVPDIYGYLPGFTPPPLLLSFADRLEELGLDVETIATAHTELSTIAEFRQMVERVRETAAQRG